jgi:peptidoglycan/LPS O-acetylase OafA/YrhL
MSSADVRRESRKLAQHQPALDGLRGIAILSVALSHSFPTIAPQGFLGVDVFFVLSGFLITQLLSNEIEATGTIAFRKFFARRILRLMPALVTVVVGTVVLLWLIPTKGFPVYTTLTRAPLSLLYVSDIARGYFNANLGLLGHTWSLSIEEHFYLLWPVTLLLLVRKYGSRVALLTALTCCTRRCHHPLQLNRLTIWAAVLLLSRVEMRQPFFGLCTRSVLA